MIIMRTYRNNCDQVTQCRLTLLHAGDDYVIMDRQTKHVIQFYTLNLLKYQFQGVK